MKNLQFIRLALIALLSATTAQAADLASAKVLKVTGNALKYTQGGGSADLQEGDILKEGDGITTSFLTSVELIFSNGTELTIDENTSLTFEEMAQEPFSGNNTYEQLSADPSRSQTLLQLNYGQVDGHVKQLRSDSSFEINTPLGTAAIRGTIFVITLKFDIATGDVILSVNNVNGIVEVKSPFLGEIEYGKKRVYETEVDSDAIPEEIQALELVVESVPPTHTVIIRIKSDNPNFDTLIKKAINISPKDTSVTPPAPPGPPPPPQVTPEDPGVQVTSPATPTPFQ